MSATKKDKVTELAALFREDTEIRMEGVHCPPQKSTPSVIFNSRFRGVGEVDRVVTGP